MTLDVFLGYLFVVGAVASAVYTAMSQDLLRVTIAFFLELACVGGVLLSLNADYLALFVFSIGIIGTVLVISYSTVIMGSLKESFLSELDNTGRSNIIRFFGMLIGLAVGVAIGWAFLSAPFLDVKKVPIATASTEVPLLGKMLLGEQVAVFELLGVMILLVVVGAGILLRKPDDAH